MRRQAPDYPAAHYTYRRDDYDQIVVLLSDMWQAYGHDFSQVHVLARIESRWLTVIPLFL